MIISPLVACGLILTLLSLSTETKPLTLEEQMVSVIFRLRYNYLNSLCHIYIYIYIQYVYVYVSVYVCVCVCVCVWSAFETLKSLV